MPVDPETFLGSPLGVLVIVLGLLIASVRRPRQRRDGGPPARFF